MITEYLLSKLFFCTKIIRFDVFHTVYAYDCFLGIYVLLQSTKDWNGLAT
jgi:hypothetical protein